MNLNEELKTNVEKFKQKEIKEKELVKNEFIKNNKDVIDDIIKNCKDASKKGNRDYIFKNDQMFTRTELGFLFSYFKERYGLNVVLCSNDLLGFYW